MAIHILYGPGGAGKSYYQMRLIYDELAYGQRNVVTNLTIDLGALQQYLEKHNPGLKIDVCQRVRILTEAETQEFWKYRGPAVLTASDLWEGSPYNDDLTGVAPLPVENRGAYGVLFVIDEAGAAGFSASGWAAKENNTTRGVACSWYLDQQRKFTDNVYASTNGRRPAGIAKPFRDKAHFFIKLKNGYLAQYGIFRGRGRFTASHYTHEPDAASEPMKEEHWELDASGLAGCYRTQDGVGVKGNSADKGARARGIPILWAIPMFIAFALLLAVGIPMWFANGVKKVAEKKAAAAQAETKAKLAESPQTPDKGKPALVTPPVRIDHESPATPTEGVKIAGIVETKHGVNVVLTDGRTLQEGEFKKFRTYVEERDGRRYYFKRPVERPLAAPTAAVVPRIETPETQRMTAREKAWAEGRGEKPDDWQDSPTLTQMGAGGMPSVSSTTQRKTVR